MVKARIDMGRTNPSAKSRELRAQLLLDPEDEWLRKHCSFKGPGYAYFTLEGKRFYLHRYIMGSPEGYLVDHRNGNRLDNRKENLRLVDRRTNAHNVEGAFKTSGLGILGVRFHQGKFAAHITVHRKQRHLGSFGTLEEAVCARLRAERDEVGIQPRREGAFKEASCGLG